MTGCGIQQKPPVRVDAVTLAHVCAWAQAIAAPASEVCIGHKTSVRRRSRATASTQPLVRSRSSPARLSQQGRARSRLPSTPRASLLTSRISVRTTFRPTTSTRTPACSRPSPDRRSPRGRRPSRSPRRVSCSKVAFRGEKRAQRAYHCAHFEL